MSIGSTYQWPQYPTAKAATRLVNKGMVVVASAGNSGATGLYSTGAPSVGDKVISVASFDNTHIAVAVVHDLARRHVAIGYNPATGAPPPPTSGSAPLARTGTATSTADALRSAAGGQPDRPGRADPARHLQLLHQGVERAGRRRGRAWCSTTTPRGALNATVAGYRPRSRSRWSASSAVDGALIDSRLASGPVRPDLDRRWRLVPQPDRRPDLGLQRLRHVAGPAAQARHRRARRRDLLDLSAGTGAATPPSAAPRCPRRTSPAPSRCCCRPRRTPRRRTCARSCRTPRSPKPWSRQSGPGLPRQRPSPGRRHAAHRRCGHHGDPDRPGQAVAGRKRGRSGHAGRSTLHNSGNTAVTYALSSVNARVHRRQHLRADVHPARCQRAVRHRQRHPASRRQGDGRSDDHAADRTRPAGSTAATWCSPRTTAAPPCACRSPAMSATTRRGRCWCPPRTASRGWPS